MGAVLETILALVQPVLVALIGWGVAALTKWLGTQTTATSLAANALLMSEVKDAAIYAVMTVEQTVTSKLDEPMNLAQQQNAKAQALELMRLHLGSGQLNALKKLKGFNDQQLKTFLEAQIEAAYYQHKLRLSVDLPPSATVTVKPSETLL